AGPCGGRGRAESVLRAVDAPPRAAQLRAERAHRGGARLARRAPLRAVSGRVAARPGGALASSLLLPDRAFAPTGLRARGHSLLAGRARRAGKGGPARRRPWRRWRAAPPRRRAQRAWLAGAGLAGLHPRGVAAGPDRGGIPQSR